MSTLANYTPGHAAGAVIADRTGDDWTLVVVRELKHSPEKVWEAITDPAQLSQWAPYDADAGLGTAGAHVKLTTVGAPKETVSDTEVKRAERPNVLEYNWGQWKMRWELEPFGKGTKLTLSTQINRHYIAMGAAGWHVCFDVMDRLLDGDPIGRTTGPAAMQFEGWQRLFKEYSELFDVPMPKWAAG